MSRSHRIWIEANGGTAKGFGNGSDSSIRMSVNVGTSASYSRQLTEIEISQHEHNGEISFSVRIDGEVYRREKIDMKTKNFGGIKGFKINGNPMVQERKEKKSANSFMRTVGNIAALGEIFADTQKEKNDWKARMIKAGLGNRGLSMPDDWDTLSEDEKQRRLDGVIKIAQEQE